MTGPERGGELITASDITDALRGRISEDLLPDAVARLNETAVSRITVSSSFEGPCPPPALLEGYAAIDPSLPNRIFELTEREQALSHEVTRHNMQAAFREQKHDHLLNLIGLAIASLLALLGVGAAVFFAWEEKPIAATFSASLGLIGLVGRFISDRRLSHKNQAPDPRPSRTES